jgi:hypothetical protein
VLYSSFHSCGVKCHETTYLTAQVSLFLFFLLFFLFLLFLLFFIVEDWDSGDSHSQVPATNRTTGSMSLLHHPTPNFSSHHTSPLYPFSSNHPLRSSPISHLSLSHIYNNKYLYITLKPTHTKLSLLLLLSSPLFSTIPHTFLSHQACTLFHLITFFSLFQKIP